MQILTKIRSFAVAVSSTAALALAVPAFAQHGVVVVARGGGYYGGYRVGYYGGYRGYYGYRRWYGGYYYPWGWGWGGLGLAPYYYSAYWYGGIPYYYANNAYFLPGSAMAQYGTIAPPAGVSQLQRQAPSELFIYPNNSQSQYQQSTDRYECYRWAVLQLGYDPTSAGGGTVRRDLTDYNRAQTACLAARGYSVE
jgi:hypothetical protein